MNSKSGMADSDVIQKSHSFCMPSSPKRAKIQNGTEHEYLVMEMFGSSSGTKNVLEVSGTQLPDTCRQDWPSSQINLQEEVRKTLGIQRARQEDVKYSGYEFGDWETGDVSEGNRIQRYKLPDTVLCASSSKHAAGQMLCPELMSEKKGSLMNGDLPCIIYPVSSTGGASETGNTLNCIENNISSADEFEMQRSLLESHSEPDVPTNESEPKGNLSNQIKTAPKHSCSGNYAEMVDCTFENVTVNAHMPNLNKRSTGCQMIRDDCEPQLQKNSRSENESKSCIKNMFYTSAEMKKDVLQNEENITILEANEKGNADFCDIEAKAQNNYSIYIESPATEMDAFAGASIETYDSLLKRNSEDNETENIVEPKHSLPQEAWGNVFCRTAKAFCECEKHVTGNVPETDSQTPVDVINVETATRACISETEAEQKANKICLGDPDLFFSNDTETNTARKYAVPTSLEGPIKEENIISILKDVIRLPQSTEIIPILDRKDEFNGLPFANNYSDDVCLSLVQGDATVGQLEDKTWNTNKELPFEVEMKQHGDTQVGKEQISDNYSSSHLVIKQPSCTRVEVPGTKDKKELHRQEFHPVSTFRTADDFYIFERANTSMMDLMSEESDQAKNGSSYINNPQRVIDNACRLTENMAVNQLANEKKRHVTDTGVREPEPTNLELISSAASGVPSKEEQNSHDVETTDAKCSSAGAEEDIFSSERGPADGCVVLESPDNKRVEETRSRGRQTHVSDTHLVEREFIPGSVLFRDAVVPELDSNKEDDASEKYAGIRPGLSVLFASECVPTAFHTFEKRQPSSEIEQLEHRPPLNRSPSKAFASSSVMTGPLDEVNPSLSSVDRRNTNEQLTENNTEVFFQDGCAHDCSSSVLAKSSQGALHENSLNSFQGCIKMGHEVPDILSCDIPPNVCSEEADQSLVIFNKSFLAEAQVDFTGPIYPPKKESVSPLKSDNEVPKFEMKKTFDLVLEELCLHLEISPDAVAALRRKTIRHHQPEEINTESQFSDLSCSALEKPCSTDEEQYECTTRNVRRRLEETSRGGLSCEQEVPLQCSHLNTDSEDSMYFTGKNIGEPREALVGGSPWTPAFLHGQNGRQCEQFRKLEPLKTCTRPIRVGLSRRARTKQLHPRFK